MYFQVFNSCPVEMGMCGYFEKKKLRRCTNLSVVVEISKLCLPAHQLVRVTHGESQFKSQHSKLRQRAIAHCVPRLVWGYMFQRTVYSEI